MDTAYCFVCEHSKIITRTLSGRIQPSRGVIFVAVALMCGHECYGDERIVMRPKAYRKLRDMLVSRHFTASSPGPRLPVLV